MKHQKLRIPAHELQPGDLIHIGGNTHRIQAVETDGLLKIFLSEKSGYFPNGMLTLAGDPKLDIER